MSKGALIIAGIVIWAFVMFTALSLIQFKRGPRFLCFEGQGEKHTYQVQYGFPLVFAARSVSPSLCGFVDARYYADNKPIIGEYATHHVYPLAFAIDASIWVVIAGVLVAAVRKFLP